MQVKTYTFVYGVWNGKKGELHREKYTTTKTLKEKEIFEYGEDCAEQYGHGILSVWQGKRGKIRQYRF